MNVPKLCFEPSNRNIIIEVWSNICERSAPGAPKEEAFLHFKFATPVVQVCAIPVELPISAAGVSITIREDEEKVEPLDIQLNMTDDLVYIIDTAEEMDRFLAHDYTSLKTCKKK